MTAEEVKALMDTPCERCGQRIGTEAHYLVAVDEPDRLVHVRCEEWAWWLRLMGAYDSMTPTKEPPLDELEGSA